MPLNYIEEKNEEQRRFAENMRDVKRLRNLPVEMLQANVLLLKYFEASYIYLTPADKFAVVESAGM